MAGRNSYPVLARYSKDGGVDRANASVLSYVEGLLRAIAATTEEEMDSRRWTKRVRTFDGEVEYVLSLTFLLHPPDFKQRYEHGVMPDRRAMEMGMAQIGRFLEGLKLDTLDEVNAAIQKEFGGTRYDELRYPGRTPPEQAQDICYQSFGAWGRGRVILARRALQLCPDCADAYVVLAENSRTPEKAHDLYALGVEAGRRALGEQPFKERVGDFWDIDFRPFMRALMGLAMIQETLGDVGQALANYRELLRLNPGDNQGARYLLLPLLIAEGRDEEALRLADSYEGEIAATWLYSRALLAFRKEGDGPAARRLLQRALAENKYVPGYLLGDEELPPSPPAYSPGSQDEAIVCAEECAEAWDCTPGALTWLEATLTELRKAEKAAGAKSGKSKKGKRKWKGK